MRKLKVRFRNFAADSDAKPAMEHENGPNRSDSQGIDPSDEVCCAQD